MSKKLEPSILYFPSPTKKQKIPRKIFFGEEGKKTHTETHTQVHFPKISSFVQIT
jgi:hypothetical protein